MVRAAYGDGGGPGGGALGIAILWASGVELPTYPPPGIQLAGVVTALIAGAAAIRVNYRKAAPARR